MSTEQTVVWEDPAPQPKPRKGRHEDAIAEVGEHPGKWGRVATFSTSTSAKKLADEVEAGEYGIVTREGKWEARHGWIDEGGPQGSYATWVRKVPESEPAPVTDAPRA